MYNSQKTSHRAKGKWDAVITSLALFASIIGLGALSIASYYQTLYAFDNLKDPTMIILNIPFGMYIPVFAALASQYGQNLALYSQKQFGTEEKVFKIGNFVFKNKHGYLVAFAIAALIDAGTNCQWYYGTNRASQDPVYWQAVMYMFMVALVFVEEVLGLAIQAFVRSLVELRRISAIERGDRSSQENRVQENKGQNTYRPNQQFNNSHGLGKNGFQQKGNKNSQNPSEQELQSFLRQQQIIDSVRLRNNNDD